MTPLPGSERARAGVMLELETYNLRKSVYITSAKEAGFEALQWEEVKASGELFQADGERTDEEKEI